MKLYLVDILPIQVLNVYKIPRTKILPWKAKKIHTSINNCISIASLSSQMLWNLITLFYRPTQVLRIIFQNNYHIARLILRLLKYIYLALKLTSLFVGDARSRLKVYSFNWHIHAKKKLSNLKDKKNDFLVCILHTQLRNIAFYSL